MTAKCPSGLSRRAKRSAACRDRKTPARAACVLTNDPLSPRVKAEQEEGLTRFTQRQGMPRSGVRTLGEGGHQDSLKIIASRDS